MFDTAFCNDEPAQELILSWLEEFLENDIEHMDASDQLIYRPAAMRILDHFGGCGADIEGSNQV